MRTIAIGDIHGCRTALENLAKYAGFSKGDTIVTLGDYVDRGPDSKGVIDFILSLRKEMEVISLMGNHEIMMLAARDSPDSLGSWAVGGVGGEQTLQSYGAADFSTVPQEHWEFIENGLPYHEIATHFFVHANADADIPLQDQSQYALHWAKFNDPPPHQNGKIMVCGHTSQRSGVPRNIGHAICIDTAACRGRWLTGLDVTTGHYWQCNEHGGFRKDVISAHL